jgi:hypothetical protein
MHKIKLSALNVENFFNLEISKNISDLNIQMILNICKKEEIKRESNDYCANKESAEYNK